MLRTVGWMAALSVLALLLSGPVAAQNEKAKDKAKDKDKDKDKDVDKDSTATQWVTVTKVAGKVSAVYEDKRKLRISVPFPKLDAGQVNALMQAKQSYAQAQARRDYNGM